MNVYLSGRSLWPFHGDALIINGKQGRINEASPASEAGHTFTMLRGPKTSRDCTI